MKEPCNYQQYPHSAGLWKALRAGIKRVLVIRSRRGGKDRDFFEYIWRDALQNLGNYLYIFPLLVQGKRSLWDTIDLDGNRIFDYIPSHCIYKINNADFMITLVHPENPNKAGSTIQLIGGDAAAAKIRGSNPRGVACSEWAWHDPDTYSVLIPALLLTKGYILLNSTVLGHNHLYDLYNSVIDNPDWYVEYSPASVCRKHDGSPLFEPKELRSEIDAGVMSVNKFLQEFQCDFDAANEGACFSYQLDQLKKTGRCGDIKYVPGVPVCTFMDIGVNKLSGKTSIWFVQFLKNSDVLLLDYYENSDEDIEHYVRVMKEWARDRVLILHKVYLPHDSDSRHAEAKKCPKANKLLTYKMRMSKFVDVDVIPRISRKAMAIEAARIYFPKYHINEKACKRGLEALAVYTTDQAELAKLKWCTHPVDAFLAIGQHLTILGESGNTPRRVNPVSHQLKQPAW